MDETPEEHELKKALEFYKSSGSIIVDRSITSDHVEGGLIQFNVGDVNVPGGGVKWDGKAGRLVFDKPWSPGIHGVGGAVGSPGVAGHPGALSKKIIYDEAEPPLKIPANPNDFKNAVIFTINAAIQTRQRLNLSAVLALMEGSLSRAFGRRIVFTTIVDYDEDMKIAYLTLGILKDEKDITPLIKVSRIVRGDFDHNNAGEIINDMFEMIMMRGLYQMVAIEMGYEPTQSL